MSKHPWPWTIDMFWNINDANGNRVCEVASDADPETRAVLLHAAEMWKRIKAMAQPNGTYDIRWATAVDMERMIEAEIAAGRKT